MINYTKYLPGIGLSIVIVSCMGFFSLNHAPGHERRFADRVGIDKILIAQYDDKPVKTSASSSEKVPFRETVIGHSVEERPIRAAIWNQDSPRPATFIFAAIHGDERTAGKLGQMLYERWRKDPSKLGGSRVILVPVANPDGWERKTRGNANQVDCNRNFPNQWKPRKSGAYNSGPFPFSEPETRVLAELVEREKPAKIISIHSCRSCGGLNNFDGPAIELAQEMTRHNGYKVDEEYFNDTPGSFGTYAGKARRIPTITLELPRIIKSDMEWAKNIEAVESAVQFNCEKDDEKKQ